MDKEVKKKFKELEQWRFIKVKSSIVEVLLSPAAAALGLPQKIFEDTQITDNCILYNITAIKQLYVCKDKDKEKNYMVNIIVKQWTCTRIDVTTHLSILEAIINNPSNNISDHHVFGTRSDFDTYCAVTAADVAADDDEEVADDDEEDAGDDEEAADDDEENKKKLEERERAARRKRQIDASRKRMRLEAEEARRRRRRLVEGPERVLLEEDKKAELKKKDLETKFLTKIVTNLDIVVKQLNTKFKLRRKQKYTARTRKAAVIKKGDKYYMVIKIEQNLTVEMYEDKRFLKQILKELNYAMPPYQLNKLSYHDTDIILTPVDYF